MKALLVIDMLRDFVEPDGALYIKGSEKIVPAVKREIERARSEGIPVIYICDAHAPDDEEFRAWPPHCVRGTRGAEVVPELAPVEGDVVVEKTRCSGFFRTDLERILKDKGIKTLRVTGVATSICVLYTVADARMRDFEVEVVKEAVWGLTEEDHNWALRQMEHVLLARVI